MQPLAPLVPDRGEGPGHEGRWCGQWGNAVIESKTGKFQPKYAGKLNFYVALVDDVLRRQHHNETIGMLICGTKNDRTVRDSLGRATSLMAVSAHTHDKTSPGRTTVSSQRRAHRRSAGMGEPDVGEEAR